MRPILLTLLACALALGLGGTVRAQERQVRIAAAADLKWALEEARGTFERGHPGIRCTLTFGSSGTLFTQLTQKAPFDLFLSADRTYPDRLAAEGLGLKESLFSYGLGFLVVWVPTASPIPVEQLGLRAVLDPAARRIAITNPRHAPYGRAAEAALRADGCFESIQGKLVFGENVAQTAQFVELGHADVGLIAYSLALSPALHAKGRYWRVPSERHPPLDQGGVILGWAQDLEAARAFRAFLLGSEGQAILSRYGFAPPRAR